MHALGILGGTFDPVHMGHLETALAARRALGLDRVLLVPSNVPPHRRDAPAASAFHRFAMTALAVPVMIRKPEGTRLQRRQPPQGRKAKFESK